MMRRVKDPYRRMPPVATDDEEAGLPTERMPPALPTMRCETSTPKGIARLRRQSLLMLRRRSLAMMETVPAVVKPWEP
jgi:hypothetical protein